MESCLIKLSVLVSMMNYVFHLILCRVEGGELFDKVVSISQYDELCFPLNSL